MKLASTNTGMPGANSLPVTPVLGVLFLVVLPLFFSCDPARVYEKNARIPDGVWERENIIRFDVPVEDTITSHNLYVNVRNTPLYPFRNLYLFITTTAPSGHSIRDTVEVILADEDGKKMGSGLGDIWDLQQLYKENIRFAQQGTYRFEYEQAMRMERLPFILDVGLRVEKAD